MKQIDNPSQEFWMTEWCLELQEVGYIDRFSTGDDIVPLDVYKGLSMTKTITKVTKRTTKEVEVSKKILNTVTYKPDIVITWAEKAKGIFFTPIGEWKTTYFYAIQIEDGSWISPIDVKAPPGSTRMNSSDSSFRILQKWIWEKFSVFINKSVNYPASVIKDKNGWFKRFKNPEPYLWMSTFTPNRYLYTDKKLEPKKISNWDPITLQQFLASVIKKPH